MNAKDFDKIVADRMAWCRQTLCAKGDEYAREGDRLWNFKVAARKLNCHPAQALAGMMVKHTVSVDDIIDGLARGIVPPKELVAEKIGDSIDYLLLLEGLIEEARGEVPEVSDTLHEGSSTEPWPAAVSEQDTRRREQAAMSAQRRGAMDALASACGYTIPPLQDGDDDWSGGKGQCSLEREGQIVADEVRAFGEQLVAKLNNTVICTGCGRRWPSGSEQGRSVSATGRCIVCRVDKERATYTTPPPQDGDDDPEVVKLEGGGNKKVAGGAEMIPGCGEAIADGCSRGDAWSWKMEYCKTHGLTPTDAENWSRAERAFTRGVQRRSDEVIAEIEKKHRDEIAKIEREHLVHVVPDRTSRGGEVEASDWRPCPND